MSLPISYYLVLSALLFFIGSVGVLTRRNAIVLFMSIEVMLNGVNLTFIAFAKYWGDYTGHLFAFMVIAVAAAEAGVGLALIVNLWRLRGTVNVDEADMLRN